MPPYAESDLDIGELPQLTREIIREAEGPVSTRSIVVAALARKGVKAPGPGTRTRIGQLFVAWGPDKVRKVGTSKETAARTGDYVDPESAVAAACWAHWCDFFRWECADVAECDRKWPRGGRTGSEWRGRNRVSGLGLQFAVVGPFVARLFCVRP